MGCGTSTTQVNVLRPVSWQQPTTVKTETESPTLKAETEPSTVTTETEQPIVKTEIEQQTVKTETEPPIVTTETEQLTAKTETKPPSLNAETQSPSVNTETVSPSLNAETEQSTVTTETESPTLKAETEQSTVNTETEQSIVKTETEQSPVNTETEQSIVKTETEQSPVNTETEQPIVKTETEQPIVKTETEHLTVKADIEPPSVNTETEQLIVNTETEPPAVNTEAEQPIINTETEPPSDNTETEPPSAKTELSPIVIPDINKDREFPVYTVDDVAKNNAEKGRNNWFLYGRKVYALDLFIPIVYSRVQDYLNMTDQKRYKADILLTGRSRNVGLCFSTCMIFCSYPVYIARNHGVRREEMEKVLPACQIGKLRPISREDYLSRTKHSVDIVKSDIEAEEKVTEYLADYLEQLSRWLSSYPNVELEQTVMTNDDPNRFEFPLPDKIRTNSTVIRQWARDWVEFDMTIDDGGAWYSYPFLNEDWGDVHQTYVDTCATREDSNIPDMNMEIEGEAAWDVIKLDIVKNDETIEKQELTWKTREKRKYLKDPERMRKRRKRIANRLLKRHKNRLKSEDMIPYEDWAHRLEEHCKEFQTLCETFVQSRRITNE